MKPSLDHTNLLVFAAITLAAAARVFAGATPPSPGLDADIRKADVICVCQIRSITDEYQPTPLAQGSPSAQQVTDPAEIMALSAIRPAAQYDMLVVATLRGSPGKEFKIRLPLVSALFYYDNANFAVDAGVDCVLLLNKSSHGALVPTDATLPLIPLGKGAKGAEAARGDVKTAVQALMISSLQDVRVRRADLYLLRESAGADLPNAAQQYFADEDPRVRASALRCAAYNQDPAAIPLIAQFEISTGNSWCSDALGYYHTRPALPLLEEVVAHGPKYARLNGMRALAGLADYTSAPSLIAAMKGDQDPDRLVAFSAYRTLHRLAGRAAGPALDYPHFMQHPDAEITGLAEWLSTHQLKETSPRPAVVRIPFRCSASELTIELGNRFSASPGGRALSIVPDDHACYSEFSEGGDDLDVLVETNYPEPPSSDDSDGDSTFLDVPNMPSPPEVFLIGERKVVAVLGAGISAQSLSVTHVGGILAGVDKDKDGNPLPGAAVPALPAGFAGVHRYCEPDKSWCRGALSAWCMQYVIQKPGYRILAHHPFRDDITDCVDGDEVIAKVKRDPRGIGFFQYRPGMHLEGVHVVPISAGGGKAAVAFKEGDWLQEDYPFSEPILLYLHPKAPPLARAFCEFAVGKEAAGIAAKYGVITAYAQRQAEGEERLREAAAGKGPVVTVVGPAQTRGLLRDLEPAYVRARDAMRMQYVVQTGAEAVEVFHARHGVVILSEGDLKKVEGASGGSGTVGETPVPLCSRAVAVIVNGHSPLKSMTVEGVQEAFVTGKLPEGSVPEGSDGVVHGYGVDAPDPASYLFWRGVGAGGSGRVKYEKNAEGVIKDVAGDRAGMGFINSSELPADVKKTGIKVLAIGEGKNAVGPLGKGYLLAERWYLLVDPQADAETKEFADFLTGDGDGDAEDVIRHDGFFGSPKPQSP